jgi:hypothetical protein
MRNLVSIFLFFVLLMAVSSCYYDKEELLYPATNNTPCTDTTTVVSYSKNIMPLLQAQCYGCHNSSFPSGNITMGTYIADKSVAQSGKLYGSITYSSGYSPMPKGTSKMSNCQISLIKKWVDAGMPNN